MGQQDFEVMRNRLEESRLKLFGYMRDTSGKTVEPVWNVNENTESLRERLYAYRRTREGAMAPPSWMEPNENTEKHRLELFGYVRGRQGEIEAGEGRSETIERAREKLFGYRRDRKGEIQIGAEVQTEIEEQATELSPETLANIEVLKKETVERKIREQFHDPTTEKSKRSPLTRETENAKIRSIVCPRIRSYTGALCSCNDPLSECPFPL